MNNILSRERGFSKTGQQAVLGEPKASGTFGKRLSHLPPAIRDPPGRVRGSRPDRNAAIWRLLGFLAVPVRHREAGLLRQTPMGLAQQLVDSGGFFLGISDALACFACQSVNKTLFGQKRAWEK